MGHHLVPADWPALTETELARLFARIPRLARGGPVKLLWHSPRPFSSAALASVAYRRLIVKRHSAVLRSVASLEAEHAFVRHLVARGVRAPLAIDDGASSAWEEGAFVYEVQEALDGHDLYAEAPSWTPFLSVQHAASAGAELARLHLASAGYEAPARPAQALHASARVVSAEEPVAAAESLADELPGLAGYLAENWAGPKGPWRRQLKGALAPFHEAFLPYASALSPLWAHNDWHPSNLLWSSSTVSANVSAVIDFGLADRTSACYDLAMALERTAVGWLEQPSRRPRHEDHAGALIGAYSLRRRLTTLEAAALARLLPLVHVDYALSEVDYFWRVVRSPKNAELAWAGYLIGHLEWWASRHGRQLLAHIGRKAALAAEAPP